MTTKRYLPGNAFRRHLPGSAFAFEYRGPKFTHRMVVQMLTSAIKSHVRIKFTDLTCIESGETYIRLDSEGRFTERDVIGAYLERHYTTAAPVMAAEEIYENYIETRIK